MNVVTMLLLWAGCMGAMVPPAAPPDAEGLFARIHTNKGTITVLLEFQRTPMATASFVGLAEGTIDNPAFPPGRPFYDGSPFHRVVPGHVIQAGAPDSDEAESPGYVYPNEIHAHLTHNRAGVLGVANGGPHTNSGQFYITLADRSYLDGIYIAFGEVVDGMDVVMAIREGDRVDSVRVVRRGDQAEAFRPTTESFEEMVRRAEARVAEHEEAKARAEEEWLGRNLPELEGEPGGVRTGVLDRAVCAPAEHSASGAELRVCYRGTALRYEGDHLEHEGPPLDEMPFGSGPDGAPGYIDPPEAFPFTPGVTALNPGLDAALAELGPGERRIVVVPADLAYGSNGLFTPERPGEPRFVIPPNTTLVYEVEILLSRR